VRRKVFRKSRKKRERRALERRDSVYEKRTNKTPILLINLKIEKQQKTHH